MKQKEYMKLIIDIPVKELPTFFQFCQELGLTGEGYRIFLLSLDFHGETDPMYTSKSQKFKDHKMSDEELRELIFKDVGASVKNSSKER